jgi:hypothetical protein
MGKAIAVMMCLFRGVHSSICFSQQLLRVVTIVRRPSCGMPVFPPEGLFSEVTILYPPRG